MSIKNEILEDSFQQPNEINTTGHESIDQTTINVPPQPPPPLPPPPPPPVPQPPPQRSNGEDQDFHYFFPYYQTSFNEDLNGATASAAAAAAIQMEGIKNEPRENDMINLDMIPTPMVTCQAASLISSGNGYSTVVPTPTPWYMFPPNSYNIPQDYAQPFYDIPISTYIPITPTPAYCFNQHQPTEPVEVPATAKTNHTTTTPTNDSISMNGDNGPAHHSAFYPYFVSNTGDSKQTNGHTNDSLHEKNMNHEHWNESDEMAATTTTNNDTDDNNKENTPPDGQRMADSDEQTIQMPIEEIQVINSKYTHQRFPIKLWNLASDKDFKPIKWSADGMSLIIDEYSLEPNLGYFFRSKKFSSFLRQLHLYGFRKVTRARNHRVVDQNGYGRNDDQADQHQHQHQQHNSHRNREDCISEYQCSFFQRDNFEEVKNVRRFYGHHHGQAGSSAAEGSHSHHHSHHHRSRNHHHCDTNNNNNNNSNTSTKKLTSKVSSNSSLPGSPMSQSIGDHRMDERPPINGFDYYGQMDVHHIEVNNIDDLQFDPIVYSN